MKKLFLSISILFLSWTASIAQDTTTKKQVVLPENIARAVVKDLVKGDSDAKELELNKTSISLLQTEIQLNNVLIVNQDKQISLYKDMKANYDKMILLKDAQLSVLNVDNARLAKELKKVKRRSTFAKITSGLLIGGLTVLYLYK